MSHPITILIYFPIWSQNFKCYLDNNFFLWQSNKSIVLYIFFVLTTRNFQFLSSNLHWLILVLFFALSVQWIIFPTALFYLFYIKRAHSYLQSFSSPETLLYENEQIEREIIQLRLLKPILKIRCRIKFKTNVHGSEGYVTVYVQRKKDYFKVS